MNENLRREGELSESRLREAQVMKSENMSLKEMLKEVKEMGESRKVELESLIENLRI